MTSRAPVRDHDFPSRYEAPPDLDAGPNTQRTERRSWRTTSFHLCLALACVAAALTFVPLWAPLLLASWMALVFKPLHAKLVNRVGGRGGAAAVVTVLLVVGSLAPVVVMSLSLFDSAASLAKQLQKSNGAREALQTLLTSEPTVAQPKFDAQQVQVHAREILDFARQHGGGALNAASTIFGAATNMVIALFVFVYAFYVFLVHSRRFHEWLLDHSPLERWQTLRLSRAYSETGRGLLIGVGLTALVQGGVATLGYVIIGAPQPLVLGLLTTFAALIPSVGTGLVWVPLAAGLAIADRTGQAAAIVGLGVVISVADNFIRPWLSRFGRVDLDMFVLFIAMLGGIAMFGTWGLLVGPLFVRLAIEALRLGRERQDLGDSGRLVQAPGASADANEEGTHA
jgi:predicted PurR-regulated permease PerM